MFARNIINVWKMLACFHSDTVHKRPNKKETKPKGGEDAEVPIRQYEEKKNVFCSIKKILKKIFTFMTAHSHSFSW